MTTTKPWPRPDQSAKAASLWLLLVAAVVMAMVVLGGVTRITGSGLSITQWDLISGVFPPLSHSEWEKVFGLYQATPQYRLVNSGMSLAQFKSIFWWEWGHRFLGRLLGVVFLAPFLILLALKRFPRRLIWRCILLFGLGALQGVVGWWMVQSGLEARTSVAPERLATHLSLALLLFVGLIWTALEAWFGQRRLAGRGRSGWIWPSTVFAAAVYVQCLLGALVAGNHAGLVDSDWPLMGGRLIPGDYWRGSLWATAAHGAAAAQFNHRLWAYALLIAGAWMVAASLRPKSRAVRPLIWLIGALLAAQVALGVATLLLTVPLPLAMLHQFTAVSILACATALAWRARRVLEVL